MSHKCFISFKYEDIKYKEAIQKMGIDMIDKSLNEKINSDNVDYIMQKIRSDYLADSTVTIFLIGEKSAEDTPWEDQTYIKRELQASLYNGTGNTRSGILGVVLPNMISKIYLGNYTCVTCGNSHNYVKIDNDTTIREFNYNYYIPKNYGCCWNEDDRYCVLVKWDDFKSKPEQFIDDAFNKRNTPISKKVRVYPE